VLLHISVSEQLQLDLGILSRLLSKSQQHSHIKSGLASSRAEGELMLQHREVMGRQEALPIALSY
jgi:hypothetical protein